MCPRNIVQICTEEWECQLLPVVDKLAMEHSYTPST